MASNEQTITTFETRVRQMILRFQQVKKENEELYKMLEESEGKIKELREQLASKTQEYESYRMARLIEVADGDLDSAKERLAKLIRDVNKCINVLAEQK